MTVWLEEEFLEKNKEQARKKAIEDSGEDLKQLQFCEIPNQSIESMDIQDGYMDVAIANDLGYFSFEIPLDTDDFVKLLEIGIKKLNKLKSVMEGLK